MMSLTTYEVDVQLPKFSTERTVEMKRVLEALGVTEMFDPAKADFSRISDDPLSVSGFKQKCAIDVNEEGTEATSTTVSASGDTSPEPIPMAEFHANRPFIYMITENTTGSIYFIGTYQ